jgi:hypothetical protein
LIILPVEKKGLSEKVNMLETEKAEALLASVNEYQIIEHKKE